MQSERAEGVATPEAPAGGVVVSADASRRDRIRAVINRIAQHMGGENPRIPVGDQAALRRLKPGEPGGAAFWKVAVGYLEEPDLLPTGDSPSRDQAERRWATILWALAVMKDHHRPDYRHGLGRALRDAEVAEPRVLRLLRAHDDQLLDAVRFTIHPLASGGYSADLADLAELVDSDGTAWEAQVRRRIARAYYRTEHKAEAES